MVGEGRVSNLSGTQRNKIVSEIALVWEDVARLLDVDADVRNQVPVASPPVAYANKLMDVLEQQDRTMADLTFAIKHIALGSYRRLEASNSLTPSVDAPRTTPSSSTTGLYVAKWEHVGDLAGKDKVALARMLAPKIRDYLIALQMFKKVMHSVPSGSTDDKIALETVREMANKVIKLTTVASFIYLADRPALETDLGRRLFTLIDI